MQELEKNEMKEHTIRFNIVAIATSLVIGYFVGFITGYKCNRIENDIKPIDTTYNKIVLDSIEYNIRTKDTIIYNIKKQMKYEIEEAIVANDNDAVRQFKELCTSE